MHVLASLPVDYVCLSCISINQSCIISFCFGCGCCAIRQACKRLVGYVSWVAAQRRATEARYFSLAERERQLAERLVSFSVVLMLPISFSLFLLSSLAFCLLVRVLLRVLVSLMFISPFLFRSFVLSFFRSFVLSFFRSVLSFFRSFFFLLSCMC